MKWKGCTERPVNDSRILFEIKGSLMIGQHINGDIYDISGSFYCRHYWTDKWMYESEAKRILYEHSWPTLKYEEDR
jgi:hypothetical protein